MCLPLGVERFAGKAALITGAGSGIGRSVTSRLVEEGGAVLAEGVEVFRKARAAMIAETVQRFIRVTVPF